MVHKWFVVLLFLWVAGCRSQSTSQLRDSTDLDDRQLWVAKLARTLRYNGPLTAGDNVAHLSTLPREQLVDLFMADPRFIDTVYDFNLYFLGFKPASIYQQNGQLTWHMFHFPQAVNAAKAVQSGGDYLSLFYWDQPNLVIARLPGDAADEPMSSTALSVAAAEFDKLIGFLKTASPNTPGCRTPSYRGKILDPLVKAGFDANFGLILLDALTEGVDLCNPTQTMVSDLEQRRSAFTSIAKVNSKLFPFKGQGISNVRLLDQSLTGLPIKQNFFSLSAKMWGQLPNSSTNYNRKRAAYMLRTFFCDDLVPINVPAPEKHSGNRHADDPSCQACHYKLDPMAGFFRNYDGQGRNQSMSDALSFSDGALIVGDQKQAYLDQWRAPKGSAQPLMVGVIQSPDPDAERNFYGDDLPDLFGYLGSPEARSVRQCLVKRMAEYFISGRQAFSGAWLDTLANEFDTAAKTDPRTSANAFKSVVKKLVLSKTFAMQDPEASQCYDFVSGQQSKVPCEVDFIIKKSCAGCHNNDHASGGLDLTAWIKDKAGEGNFIHRDPSSDKQLPRLETMKRISERLSSTDPDFSMPLSSYMDPTDRATLFKWVNQVSPQ